MKLKTNFYWDQIAAIHERFKNFEAALAVRNLFDEIGRIPSPYAPAAPDGAYVPFDYPMEGRAIWVELSSHF